MNYQFDKAALTPAVYGLIDLRDPEFIMYVGKSVCPVARFGAHYTGGAPLVKQWIRSEGVQPSFVILQNYALDELSQGELDWIAKMKEAGMALLNDPGNTWVKRSKRQKALAARLEALIPPVVEEEAPEPKTYPLRLMKAQEAADYLGIAVKDLHDIRRRGALTHYQFSKNCHRYREEHLDDYLRRLK